MALITLIDKYKADLDIPVGLGSEEISERYRAFGQELAEIPSFSYNRDDMRRTVDHMMGLELNRHARYYVVADAMRREAMGQVDDVSSRKQIWELLELISFNVETEKSRERTKTYVDNVGKSKAREYLRMIKEGFKRVHTEVEALYEAVTEDDILSHETAENHGQHIMLERMAVDNVLEIVDSLENQIQ